MDVRTASGQLLSRFALYGIGAYGAGANMAFRKSALDAMGGFDLLLGTGTPSRGGEDLVALINILWAGGKIGYEPAAVVHHRHRRTLEELHRQMDGNGVGFTAMMIALFERDKRHILTLGFQVPRAALQLARSSATKVLPVRRVHGATPEQEAERGYPRSLAVHELGNYSRGPLQYRRSRTAARKWLEQDSEANRRDDASGHESFS